MTKLLKQTNKKKKKRKKFSNQMGWVLLVYIKKYLGILPW